jgi:hypothetical protein
MRRQGNMIMGDWYIDIEDSSLLTEAKPDETAWLTETRHLLTEDIFFFEMGY